MEKILAVAHNTFRRCFAAKTLVLILLLYIGILAFTARVDVVDEEANRVALVGNTAQGAAWLLTALATVLLGATSLSGEIADRTIYYVMTRPVARSQILAGKILGLWGVALTLLIPMQAIGYGVVRSIGDRLPADAQPYAVYRQVLAADFNSGTTAKDGMLRYGAGEAAWTFAGLQRDRLSHNKVLLKLGLGFRVDSEKLEPGEQLRHRSPRIRLTPYTNGKPHAALAVEERLYPRRTLEFAFDPSVLDEAGSVEVRVACITPKFMVHPIANHLQAVAGTSNYTWNYLKVSAMPLLGILLLVPICVLTSTFLSPPVAALFAATLFFAGTQIGFLEEYARGVARKEERVKTREAQPSHADEHGEEKILTALDRFFTPIQKVVSGFITKLFPDFRMYRRGAYELEHGLDVPGRFVWESVFYGVKYGLVCLVLALGAFRMREIG